MQPYHCDYLHVDDLVLVVARSSDFDQPHPRNGPPPLQYQQELQKHQQQVQRHQKFDQVQGEHAVLIPLDLEGDVVGFVVEV